MLIDGEKWACEACVRGHRVSNCQHSDRPLQHINKKGRPVSQCGHCRSMRKSKSSHVKCDCGEKTHKCIHLQGVVDGHKESCCCNHGGRCTCSHKKEAPSLDPVPESDSDQEMSIATKSSCAKNPLARRRRANTIHSDGMLSFDENGHHKPAYKHNKASQKTGPYQLNRVNSMHSASSLSNRSVDNLMNGSSADSGSTIDSSISSHVLHGKRRVKSEAASPMMSSNAAFSQLNGQLPPLDLSSIEYPSYISGGFDLFNNLSDHEQGLFSAGLSATSVDWSHYDLDFNVNKTGDNFAPSSYSQPPSFAGFDFNGSEQAPTLTTNTSGEVSEVEDFLGPSLDDFDASGAFGSTTTAPNTFSVGGPQTGLFNSNDLGPLDYDDLKMMKVGNKFLPTPASLAGEEPSLGVTSAGANGFSFVEDDPALWVSDYSGMPDGLPAMNDPTETGMLPLWDQQ